VSDSYKDFFNDLSGTDFEELPVDIETFVLDDNFLHLPPLSEEQYRIIKVGSQIYRLDTLIDMYGPVKGRERYAETYNEIIEDLGKGSGKDLCATIVCLYIVYLLLCLKDPSAYYRRPSDDAIDLVNIAVNAPQAKNVFFKGVKNKLEKSPWFEGKYNLKTDSIEFDKQVTLHSGHSEREAFEGLNLIFALLDEISGFAESTASGVQKLNTAEDTYDMYRASVDSRFEEFGKVMMLSWPRHKEDFITTMYNSVIAEKETVVRTHTFKLDPELPDGTEGNEFSIEWDEDHIISYKFPRVFALKRPVWDINPLRTIDSYIWSFYRNRTDSLGRFACMPSEAIEGLFKDHEKIEATFIKPNPIHETGVLKDWFVPDPDKEYYMHVDLAEVQDRCAVALAHVDKWVEIHIGADYTDTLPFVVIDAIRWWTPEPNKSIDLTWARDYIMMLKRRGFNIRMVTFDRWKSADIIDYLNQNGIKAEKLSVNKDHYTDFQMVMYDERLIGPNIEILVDELKGLIIKGNKVDHTRKSGKDLSDAVCGAIFNAVNYTEQETVKEVEVITPADLVERERKKFPENTIVAPRRYEGKTAIPEPIQEYLDSLGHIKVI
jgi:hypothetical protein